MDQSRTSFRIEEHSTLARELLVAAIAPRPIGWIATLSSSGIRNLAPYSFFNILSHDPPLIGFASVGYKDSAENARQTGEFTWNLVNRDLAEAMNVTAAGLSPAVDEFDYACVQPSTSIAVSAPCVARSPISLECRTTEARRLLSLGGEETENWLVVGQVVAAHVRSDLLDGTTFDAVAAEPVVRGGGRGEYFWISSANRFKMRRPD